jgi:hypothetical protein
MIIIALASLDDYCDGRAGPSLAFLAVLSIIYTNVV